MLARDADGERVIPGATRDAPPGGAASPAAVRRALAAAAAADSKQGTDVALLDVGPIIGITEVFVLVSGRNTRQVRTIVEEVEKAIRELDGTKPLFVEGLGDASWVLLDFGDVIVHVFLDETREYYDLDRLWADAARVPFEEARPALA